MLVFYMENGLVVDLLRGNGFWHSPCMYLCIVTFQLIQRRENGKENFYRDWKDYKNGFGDKKHGEFWLG